MAYKLMINNREIEFCEKTNYSLETLDSFTCLFENEEDLKEFLMDRNIISINDFHNKIYIFNTRTNSKSKRIIYGEFAKYLNPVILSNYFCDNSKNVNLLKKLYYTFKGRSNFNSLSMAVTKLYHFLYDLENYDNIDMEDNIFSVISEIIRKASIQYLDKRKIIDIILAEEEKVKIINNKKEMEQYLDRLIHIRHLLSLNIEDNDYESLIAEAQEIETLLGLNASNTEEKIEEEIGEEYGESSRH